MKKFLAVILAMIFAVSGCVLAFAEYDEQGDAKYQCPYCEATFPNAASLADHVNATFPVAGHDQACGNKCDKNFDGEEECCDFTTKYVSVMEQHKKVCPYCDDLSNIKKFVGYLKEGDIATAAKYLVKAIVDFVKSDTFKTIVGKVVDVVKGIDFGKIISTVKGVIEKLPLDKIKGAIGDLVG